MKSLIQNLNKKVCVNQDIVLLVLRLVVGIIFLQAGLGKIQNFENTVGFFGSIGIPMPYINAVLATAVEFIGGIMLIVGLGTRFISLPLAFVMLVAIVTTEMNNISGLSDLIRLQQLDYLLLFLLFAATGAGKHSLDSKMDCD